MFQYVVVIVDVVYIYNPSIAGCIYLRYLHYARVDFLYICHHQRRYDMPDINSLVSNIICAMLLFFFSAYIGLSGESMRWQYGFEYQGKALNMAHPNLNDYKRGTKYYLKVSKRCVYLGKCVKNNMLELLNYDVKNNINII